VSPVESRRRIVRSLGAVAAFGIAGCNTTESTKNRFASGNDSQYSGLSSKRAREITVEAEFGHVEDHLEKADCLEDM
jgi:hypothetical protein